MPIVSWFKNRRQESRLREAVILEALRVHDFSKEELERLLVWGTKRPLGDAFDLEYFFIDPFRRQRYMFFLTHLLEECAEVLRGNGLLRKPELEPEMRAVSPSEVCNSIDPLLTHCLYALAAACRHPNGPGATARYAIQAFLDLPRELCGRSSIRRIRSLERDKRLFSFMMRFVQRDHGETS